MQQSQNARRKIRSTQQAGWDVLALRKVQLRDANSLSTHYHGFKNHYDAHI